MTTAYPLNWPAGQARTQRPQSARFDMAHNKAQNELIREINLLGGKNIILSTNIPIRNDGLPYADADRRVITDKGVAVYFDYKGSQKCFACDRWDTIKDNIRAIGLSIAALRGIERWGSSDMVERAFTGYTALPAPAKRRDWWDVLGVSSMASLDVIEAAFKAKVKEHHPDQAGGNREKYEEVMDARERARQARTITFGGQS